MRSRPSALFQSAHRDLISFVTDRQGHEQRYAIDPTKIERELGRSRCIDFERGLEETVCCCLNNRAWWRKIRESPVSWGEAGTLRSVCQSLVLRKASIQMRILVLGSSGQIGFELLRAAWPLGTTTIGVSHSQIDITDASAVAHLVARSNCDLAINAAAFTAVDRAEIEPRRAFAVNRDGAGHVAAACARAGVPLIHLSTDYVFDGAKKGAYVEDDPVSPINIYGASKAAGEDAVRENHPRHLILRTSWVYGAHGHNFVKTLLRLGRDRKDIAVVCDQRGSPTAAVDLAAGISEIAERLTGALDPWGTYHLCGDGATTRYDFAQRIFALLSRQGDEMPVLRQVNSQEFPASAKRPENSQLDCRRIAEVFGVGCPSWDTSLARILPEIVASLT
jgi:dTDP-4-dehydrorhamnose reductase